MCLNVWSSPLTQTTGVSAPATPAILGRPGSQKPLCALWVPSLSGVRCFPQVEHPKPVRSSQAPAPCARPWAPLPLSRALVVSRNRLPGRLATGL